MANRPYDDDYDVQWPHSVSGNAFAELPESRRSSVRTQPTHLSCSRSLNRVKMPTHH